MSCLSCELIGRCDRNEAPAWDCILRTGSWDVVHSYDASPPGWLVLIARRHITALSQLTEPEAIDLGMLQRQVSIAIEQTVGCSKTYVAQFTEAVEHPHLHFHIIPRMAGMPDAARGPDVFSHYLGAPEGKRVPEADKDAIAASVRAAVLAMRE